MKINLCVMGCPPAPVYKGAKGEGAAGKGGRAKGSPTPTGSRIHPFLVELGGLPIVGVGGKEREGKRRRKEGGAPLP